MTMTDTTTEIVTQLARDVTWFVRRADRMQPSARQARIVICFAVHDALHADVPTDVSHILDFYGTSLMLAANPHIDVCSLVDDALDLAVSDGRLIVHEEPQDAIGDYFHSDDVMSCEACGINRYSDSAAVF